LRWSRRQHTSSRTAECSEDCCGCLTSARHDRADHPAFHCFLLAVAAARLSEPRSRSHRGRRGCSAVSWCGCSSRTSLSVPQWLHRPLRQPWRRRRLCPMEVIHHQTLSALACVVSVGLGRETPTRPQWPEPNRPQQRRPWSQRRTLHCFRVSNCGRASASKRLKSHGEPRTSPRQEAAACAWNTRGQAKIIRSQCVVSAHGRKTWLQFADRFKWRGFISILVELSRIERPVCSVVRL
jgi:hypothetical protein